MAGIRTARVCKVAPGAALCLGAATPAAGHGFGQRFDLPLPLWLWMTGAGATIVLTFAVIAFYMREGTSAGRYPRLNLLRLAPLRWIAHPAIVALVRLLAVMVFVLTLYAGFVGVQNPYSNLITTMIWVVWWVGCAFVCALILDLWMLVNPLDTIFAWCEALYAALTGGRSLSRRLPYPSWLGAWPAGALFLCFAWAELIWQDNDVPAYLARAIVVYTLVTWSGMFLYGRQVWLQNGEAFTILFGILGRFAPLAATPPSIPGAARALYMRPPGAGLLAGDDGGVQADRRRQQGLASGDRRPSPRGRLPGRGRCAACQ